MTESIVFIPHNGPHPGMLPVKRSKPTVTEPDATAIEANEATIEAPRASVPALRVITPCAIIRGERGSHGTFYQGDHVRAWRRDGGEDQISDETSARLIALGVLEAV